MQGRFANRPCGVCRLGPNKRAPHVVPAKPAPHLMRGQESRGGGDGPPVFTGATFVILRSATTKESQAVLDCCACILTIKVRR